MQRISENAAELEARVAAAETERKAHQAEIQALCAQLAEAQELLDSQAKAHAAALLGKDGELKRLSDELSDAVRAAGSVMAAAHEEEVQALSAQLCELQQVLESQTKAHEAALAAKERDLAELRDAVAKARRPSVAEAGSRSRISESQGQGQAAEMEAGGVKGAGRIVCSGLQLPDRELLEERAKRSRLEMEFELYQSQVLKDKQKREGDRIAVEVCHPC
jgi:hypothetical protein